MKNHITSLIVIVAACGLCIQQLKADVVTLEGTTIKVDDALFTGCYHNAFEGTVITNENGTLKAGYQGIQRTKGIVLGIDSGYDKMTLTFNLSENPKGKTTLTLRGLDDRFDATNPLRIEINGTPLPKTITFDQNKNVEKGLNQRYFLGWQDITVQLDSKKLKKGRNVLTIANTISVLDSEHWIYAAIDYVTFNFASVQKMTILRDDYPVLYYGLSEGAEVNLWPAVNVGNRICLIRGGDIQYTFVATFPEELASGKDRDIQLHVDTTADITITGVKGDPLPMSRKGKTRHFTAPLPRTVKFATPHPAQGVGTFIHTTKAFEDETLTAWYSIDGTNYQKRTYPLRSVVLDPVASRKDLDFLLSMWGGQTPNDPAALNRYISMIQGAGFNHMFTGNSTNLNRKLKQAGFEVYPRFGWFGHKYKITEKDKHMAAIGKDGKPLTKDFCPLQILAHPEHPELGRYFKHAAELSTLPNIDGICVDFETAPVWCWCDACLAAFKTETGYTVTDRSQVSEGGQWWPDYQDFGRRRNRDLLTKVREIMKEQNSELRYYSLASACDMPSYWWDGRARGRHALKELVKFSDEVAISGYFYDMPGGLKSVLPIMSTVRRLAVASGREVDTSVISPIATTISEWPRYRGATMSPDALRMHILLTAAGGGHGISLFRGDCFDGEHFVAARDAIEDLVTLKPYIQDGIDRSDSLVVTPLEDQPRLIATDMSQNLLSRMPWHPDIVYQYDAIQRLVDFRGNDRVILLFNYGRAPLKLRIKVLGLFDPDYRLTDLRTGEEIGILARRALESGELQLSVPPQTCRIIRIKVK